MYQWGCTVGSGQGRQKRPKPVHLVLFGTFYKRGHGCVHCILEEVVGVEVISSGGVIHVE